MMNHEGQSSDKKSIRAVTGKTADFPELAKDCVAFANAQGGQLLIGIEDKDSLPPASQRIIPELLDTIRKRIAELTVNVFALPSIGQAENGGEFVSLVIQRSQAVASTADGRYFLRVGDRCEPIVGDDVMRLADERPGRSWEAMNSRVPRDKSDAARLEAFVAAIRASDRVKDSVKEITPCLPLNWSMPCGARCRTSARRMKSRKECIAVRYPPLTRKSSGNCWSMPWCIGPTPNGEISFSICIPTAWRSSTLAACPSG